MGSFFKFGQAVPETFEFSAPKNGVLLDKTQEELTCLKWDQKENF